MVMFRPQGINNGAFFFCLLCRQILSGMFGFFFCSQDLQWLTLDPSPSNAHSYRRWKHMTILRMVNIIIIISIILNICVILINAFQAGWNLSVPGSYTSSTTRNQFSMLSLGKLPVVPVGNTWTIQHNIRNLFPGALIARRGQGRTQDVVCQLVGFGLVPLYVMKANGVEGTLQVNARWSATYSLHYINHVDYISYFNWIELIGIIDVIWYNNISRYNRLQKI